MAQKKDRALVKAIRAAGGVSSLARSLKMKRQAVSNWQRTPPKRVLHVERITGVPRYELRPDIYGSAP